MSDTQTTTVYVVLRGLQSEGCVVVGVYASESTAGAHAERVRQASRFSYIDYVDVEEWTVKL